MNELVFLLFFLSGACGLIYEVLWAKLLTLTLGNSGLAHALILATFMAGLGIGNWLLGRWSDRWTRTLRFYAGLELATACFAAASPSLLRALSEGYLAWMRSGAAPWLAASGELVLCSAALLIPAALMGGTLPSLVRFASRASGGMERGVSALYAANSSGAAIGALLAGFWLIPTFGLDAPVYFAAAVNLGIGIAAFLLSSLGRAGTVARTTAAPRRKPFSIGRTPLWILHGGVFVSGFIAFALEIAWIRLLSMVLGSSAYSFSLMLSAFIAGIALGSRWARRLDSDRIDPYTLFGLTQAGVAASILLTLPIYGRLPYYLHELAAMLSRTDHSFLLYEAFHFLLCFVLMLAPAIFMGMSLPAAASAAAPDADRSGEKVGLIFALNAAGNVSGALLTSLLILPALGLQPVIAAAALLSVMLAGTVLATSSLRAYGRALSAGGIVLSLLVLVALAMPAWDGRVFITGEFEGRSDYKPRSYRDYLRQFQDEFLVFNKDDADATISVVRSPSDIFLATNGKTDASAVFDLDTELLLGHVPFLFKPAARDALVVGLGSGITAGSMLTHGLERLDIVEISKGVVEADRFFSDVNRRPLEDPRTRLEIQDAVPYMSRTSRRYDLIVSEPSNPWVAGVGNLFSAEFYRVAKTHLRPGGVMEQWVHQYEMNDETLRLVLRTFASQFDRVTLWEIPPSSNDILLIGSNGSVAPDFHAMQAELESPKIAQDLARVGATGLPTLLSLQALSDPAMRTLAGDGPLNEVRFPILEYAAPKALFMRARAGIVSAADERLSRRPKEPLLLSRYLEDRRRPLSDDEFAEIAEFQAKRAGVMLYPILAEWASRYPKDNRAVWGLIQLKLQRGDEAGALTLLDGLLQSDPRNQDYLELAANLSLNVYLQGGSYLSRGLPDRALKYWARLASEARGPRRTNAFRKMAEIHANVGKLDAAEGFIAKAAESAVAGGGEPPDSLWMLGARMALDRGDRELAKRCAVNALRSNQGNEEARAFVKNGS